MQRGEVWYAARPDGDRPVLVLTRDPVADRIGPTQIVSVKTWVVAQDLPPAPAAGYILTGSDR